jgi:hypothetical protein
MSILDKIKKNPVKSLMITGVSIFILILIVYGAVFVFRTLMYKNHMKECINSVSNFCNIKKVPLLLPQNYIDPLLKIAKEDGKRIEIYKKRQKAVSLPRIKEKLPELVEWYQNLCPIISAEIGTQVITTSLNQPSSLCIVTYEKEGDFIDWHFDTNHYNGRFFTLLIPVSYEPTCGNYQYKDADEVVQTVTLQRGEAILFEGDKVFHRGKELCKDQFRVILSCTFTTSQEINTFEHGFQKIKTLGIFGE